MSAGVGRIVNAAGEVVGHAISELGQDGAWVMHIVRLDSETPSPVSDASDQ